MTGTEIVDQMGRAVTIPGSPLRIISLVPSQTELLYDLGLGERVVGITKFCVHPEEWFRNKPRVGGTKKIDFEKVRALKPDLIIGNKEENEQKDIQELEKEFPVWMSDVRDLPGALEMIQRVGELSGTKDKAGAPGCAIRRKGSTNKSSMNRIGKRYTKDADRFTRSHAPVCRRRNMRRNASVPTRTSPRVP